jgi:hypothetical protein
MIWYVLSNGGAGPTYAVVVPRTGLGEMAPTPTLLEVLERQLGKADSDALVKAFFDNVVSVNSEMLNRRPDSATCRTDEGRAVATHRQFRKKETRCA